MKLFFFGNKYIQNLIVKSQTIYVTFLPRPLVWANNSSDRESMKLCMYECMSGRIFAYDLHTDILIITSDIYALIYWS